MFVQGGIEIILGEGGGGTIYISLDLIYIYCTLSQFASDVNAI